MQPERKIKMTQKAVLSDYDELLNFENKVFKINFLKKVPKLYTDSEKCVSYHSVVKDDDKIVGAIAVYPTALVTSESELKAIGIGSVAVDSKCRGKGIMRQMMEHCDEIAKEQGADIGFLSGYRMRYERYGYIPGGLKYVYDLSDYYIAHSTPTEKFSFVPIKKCKGILPEIVSLHDSQGSYWLRSEEDFEIITATWLEHCFAVIGEDGGFCGYIIIERSRKRVSEIVLAEPSKIGDVLLCYAKEKHCKSLTVNLCEWQTRLRFEIEKIGESVKIESPAAFKIFNFKNFIEVMMNEKLRREKLPEGRMILKIDEAVYSVTVENQRCVAGLTNEEPEVVLSYTEAVLALTTYSSTIWRHPLFKAWSPMCPVSIPHVDEV